MSNPSYPTLPHAELISGDPARLENELEQLVLVVLAFHVGAGKLIQQADFEQELRLRNFTGDFRDAREAMNRLRHRGHPICAKAGKGGGYFLAACWEELEEFLVREFHAKAMDMLEQESAMRKEATRMWGNQQMRFNYGFSANPTR
jgi:hypothetical protein